MAKRSNCKKGFPKGISRSLRANNLFKYIGRIKSLAYQSVCAWFYIFYLTFLVTGKLNQIQRKGIK